MNSGVDVAGCEKSRAGLSLQVPRSKAETTTGFPPPCLARVSDVGAVALDTVGTPHPKVLDGCRRTIKTDGSTRHESRISSISLFDRGGTGPSNKPLDLTVTPLACASVAPAGQRRRWTEKARRGD